MASINKKNHFQNKASQCVNWSNISGEQACQYIYQKPCKPFVPVTPLQRIYFKEIIREAQKILIKEYVSK